MIHESEFLPNCCMNGNMGSNVAKRTDTLFAVSLRAQHLISLPVLHCAQEHTFPALSKLLQTDIYPSSDHFPTACSQVSIATSISAHLPCCLCVQDMDQQLSDARMRIVQLTAEVQSSKQKVQHHEENEAALQSQVHLLLLLCG